MQVGLALPSMVPGLDRDTLLAWMRGADAGPFSVLAAGERLGYPNQEMWALLAAAAAVTGRVGIESSVCVLPLHAEVLVAKQAATVDVLSGGRFTLGVGVGGRDEDYRLAGAPFRGRFARLDEQVATIRRVWAGETAVAGTSPVGPPPVQRPGPRVLTASMGPRSMARSARWADGIAGFDLGPDPDGVAAKFRAFEGAWADAGREGRPFLQTSAWFGLGPDAPDSVPAYARRYLSIFGDDAARAMSRMCRATSADALLDLLDRLEDTGAHEVILVVTTGDLDELRRVTDLVGGRG
jgi:alkanesulfonate monooxygenase SsuD/methylene tetrahydromethanopterin reductase-like flavin-dependent oxidoreductase (luciferase family)